MYYRSRGTFAHYIETFTHDDTLPSILNSLKYSIFSTLLALFVGIVVSYLLTRKRLPFQNLLDAIAMLPLALPGVAIAFGYMGSFADTTLLLRHLPEDFVKVIDPRENPTFLLIYQLCGTAVTLYVAIHIRRAPADKRELRGSLTKHGGDPDPYLI